MSPRKIPSKSLSALVARLLNAAVCVLLLGVLIAGCGGGGGGHADDVDVGDGGDDGTPTDPACRTAPAATGTVTINGTVTYDRVPTATVGSSVELDYTGTASKPARGVVVQALACNLSQLATAVTDDSGQYSLQVGGNIPVMIRVKAQLLSTAGATWDIRVLNNTSSDAQYVLDGALVNTTTANETRDLHAASGWGGNAYTATRAAAPFAILDSIYTGMKKIAVINASVTFPRLNVHWSTNNQVSDTEDNVAQGLLPASYYDFRSGDIYLLGRENRDTDEYDDHVILHEWGHYIEHRFGRSDNLGGAHSDASLLDARVAQSEGFGNAWSAIVSDNPVYIDTDGGRQSSGFSFNVESDSIVGFRGWFKEFSVQQIIYDLYDSNADGDDNIALGLGPIWQTLVTQLPSTPAFVTIFSFIDGIKKIVPAQSAAIDDVTSEHDMQPVNDAYGSSETNWAGLAFPTSEGTALVYEPLVLNTPQTVCTTGQYGAYNGLAVYRYFMFSAASNRSYRFAVSSSNNSQGTATPAIAIWKNGSLIREDHATSPVSQTLSSGNYVVEVYDERNIEGDPLDETGNTVPTGVNVCFAVTVTAP